MHFGDRVVEAVRRAGNAIVVGIDPRAKSLPAGFARRFPADRAGVAAAIEAFANAVVDVVAPLVPAVKFQTAYFEAYGPEGLAALHASARYARQAGLLVIIDGKRNDIGSTAEAYAEAYLGGARADDLSEPAWDADALTINPYLGSDGVRPFLTHAERSEKGVFILVRTSNPSAGEFQDLVAAGKPLYRHVAERLAEWAEFSRGSSGFSLVGAVVGATYPHELEELRAALPGVIFLVPGYGAQGATARDVCGAFNEDGTGALVNNSRGILFAYERPDLQSRFGADWQAAIAQAVHAMIDELARHTPAGRLRRSAQG